MAFMDRIQRIQRMHYLILYKRTGTPESFARKIGVSKSMIYLLIQELKQMGAPIVYCKYKGSYKYQYEVDFKFGFESPQINKQTSLLESNRY